MKIYLVLFLTFLNIQMASAGECVGGTGQSFQHAYQQADFVGQMTLIKRIYTAKKHEPSLYEVRLSTDYRHIVPKYRPKKYIFKGDFISENYRNLPPGKKYDVLIMRKESKPNDPSTIYFTVGRGDHCGAGRLLMPGEIQKNKAAARIEIAPRPHDTFNEATVVFPKNITEEEYGKIRDAAYLAARKKHYEIYENLNFTVTHTKTGKEYITKFDSNEGVFRTVDDLPQGDYKINTPIIPKHYKIKIRDNIKSLTVFPDIYLYQYGAFIYSFELVEDKS